MFSLHFLLSLPKKSFSLPTIHSTAILATRLSQKLDCPKNYSLLHMLFIGSQIHVLEPQEHHWTSLRTFIEHLACVLTNSTSTQNLFVEGPHFDSNHQKKKYNPIKSIWITWFQIIKNHVKYAPKKSMVFHLLQKYRLIIHCEVITEIPFINLHPPQYVCVYA